VEDLGDNCMADGFHKILSQSNCFTISSTVCRDKFYASQFITFSFNRELQDFLLKEIVIKKTNRQNPDEEIPDKIFNSKDFGEVSFEDFNIENIEYQVGF
jgi:predicted DNA binding protein